MLQLPSFILCLALLITFFNIGAVDAIPGRYVLQGRAHSTSVTASSFTKSAPQTSLASQTSSLSPSKSAVTKIDSAASSVASNSASDASSNSTSSTSQVIASTTTASPASTTSAVGVVETGLFNSTLTPNLLPLTPTITPAFSIAGALLIITGCIYAFIGIKIKRLQIFLSASYLTNLAITVLIVYVMNPPINNGTQGAYLAGVIVPGIVVGMGSIVFPDMTEGIGCILGGFCLAMWFLVLKPSGLITSVSGVSILISIFCALTLATCFWRTTRPYGLIFSVSFGGATAIVLGIDCFSRAGLKEFWVWIWNLNTELFPPGASTYPMTRGMKVEIAGIFIIFLAALAWQMQLWKMISKKNADKQSKRREDDENHLREEENVGKQIEERSRLERNQWEAVYGDGPKSSEPPRSIADSGVGEMDSTKKTPRSTIVSFNGQSTDGSIEMADVGMMPAPKRSDSVISPSGPESSITIRVAHDDIETIPELQQGDQPEHNEKKWVIGAEGDARLISTSSVPEVTPLPFKVPRNAENPISDDRSSVATNNDDRPTSRQSRRFSTSSNPLKHLSRTAMIRSSQRLSGINGNSGWEKMTGEEFDRRSSVAATIDGVCDKDDLESLSPDMTTLSPRSPSSLKVGGDKTLARPASMIELQMASSRMEKALVKEDERHRPKSMDLGTIFANVALEVENAFNATPPPSSPINITEETLPASPSKVVMSYRTNEWAKHLSHAEAPALEELKLNHPQQQQQYKLPPVSNPERSSPVNEGNGQENQAIDEEMPAPLDIRALRQTPTTATPAPAPRLRSRENPKASAKGQSNVNRSSAMQKAGGPPQTHQTRKRPNAGTRQSAQRSASNPAMNPDLQNNGNRNSNQVVRSSSSPALVPLYSHIPGGTGGIGTNSTPNLLSQRQSLVKQKHSFMSLNPLASTPELAALSALNGGINTEPSTPGLSGNDSPSVYSRSIHEQENLASANKDRYENMNLKERKALIQREKEMRNGAPSPFRMQSYHAGVEQQNRSGSRMMRRSPTPLKAHKDALMANWRASIQEDLQGVSPDSPIRLNNGYGNGYGMGGNATPGNKGEAGTTKLSKLQEREINLKREQLFEEKRREGMMAAMKREEEIRKVAEKEARIRMGALDGRSGVEDVHREMMRKLQKEASSV